MGKRLAVACQSIIQKYLLEREENNEEPKAKRKKDDVIQECLAYRCSEALHHNTSLFIETTDAQFY